MCYLIKKYGYVVFVNVALVEKKKIRAKSSYDNNLMK